MNKVIIIIGGSDGIGKATLSQLMSENYTCYNLSRTKIENFKNNIFCDVTKQETIRLAISKVFAIEKRITGLIYSAGFSLASPIAEINEKDYRYLYEVILFGYLETLRNVIKYCKDSSKIIFMSSLASSVPIPYDPYYSSAKAAVEVLNNGLNLELNKQNIFITNLIFGGVKTNFTYKRKVNTSKTHHYDFYNAINSLAETEQRGLDSLEIAKAVSRLLKLKVLPSNYIVGSKNKLIYKLVKVLPPKIVGYFIGHKFGLENKTLDK